VADIQQAPRVVRGWRPHAVLVALASALLLHLAWFGFLVRQGGDLAAQDAWTWFAHVHPSSAYDLAWYGGLHPAAYSLVSPYIMGVLGVRLAMVVAGTLSAGLIALILGDVGSLGNPIWAGFYAALALTGDAVSGRVTFGIGVLFGLAALTVLVVGRRRTNGARPEWWRLVTTGLFAGLATATSPVAGLFLGLVAVTLWLNGQRRASLAVGATPVVVLLAALLLFPSGGVEPMSWSSLALAMIAGVSCWVLLPRAWHVARIGGCVYAATVLTTWCVPSPIGSNVSRLGLLFGGILLVASASGEWWTSPASRRLGRPVARLVLLAAILTTSTWQVTIAGLDLVGSGSASQLDASVPEVLAQLHRRGADLGRVEVVPTKSHVEAAELAPHVELARGWNRQADVSRNPIFYRTGPLESAQYHRWLRRWGVRFVVLPHTTLDYAGRAEGELVRSGPRYLRRVWSDRSWSLYAVTDPRPVVSPPGRLRSWNSADVIVQMSEAGSATVRIAWSPWLSLVDDGGRQLSRAELDGACLTPARAAPSESVRWVTLDVRRPGLYRIGAPYSLARGTRC
jgi:hypothetical protein